MSRKKIKIDDKNNMIDPLLPLRQTKFHDKYLEKWNKYALLKHDFLSIIHNGSYKPFK